MRQLGRARGITAIGALVGLLGLAACGTSADTNVAAPTDTAADTAAAATSAAPTTTVAVTLPVTEAPTTTAAPVTIATTTVPATLPQPAPPPDPNGPDPGMELGSIQIPRIGVDRPLWEGVTLKTLNRGPGHWPGTAMPGQVGNVVIGGHRVSHDKPFRNIDQLVVGDPIVITFNGVPNTYIVTGAQVVTPNDTWVINQTPEHTATLFACHPPGSTKFRYVVFAKLAGT
ncbi:MAG TPA: class E sortase [Acidimicrobiales bacterium]